MITKLPVYPIAPLHHPCDDWEDHHATNPCCVRFESDPRVFLGYRAGGSGDRFRIKGWDVYASHMGLALLDPLGRNVIARLPLPIMRIERNVSLPQTEEEFELFQQGPNRNRTLILHDFRFWEDRGWLYVIYHEGSLTNIFDCIVRMKVSDFLDRVERSLELAKNPIEQIVEDWRKLWWQKGVWQPCGVNGTNHIYASNVTKNDIVFIRLSDGSLRMLHRPTPDIAILNTGNEPFAPTTPDGIAEFGSLQTCIRPGFRDNSHIGNNGTPVRARIGDVDVFVDIVHGVNNRRIGATTGEGWELTYFPYLRLLDADTGECLYYSEDCILDMNGLWREYTIEGTWVSQLPHLLGVMFAGGQIESLAGKNGLDDLFYTYVGVGDTAVALAEFRLRDLLPARVIADIQSGKQRRHISLPDFAPAASVIPERCCGWEWSVANRSDGRDVVIERKIIIQSRTESNARPVGARPGYFDADGLAIAPESVREIEGAGWAVVYRGFKWIESNGGRRTQWGYGLLLLDLEMPERVFYRASEPLQDQTFEEEGWTSGTETGIAAQLLKAAAQFIPENIRHEISRMATLKPMPSHMAKWLREKAAIK